MVSNAGSPKGQRNVRRRLQGRTSVLVGIAVLPLALLIAVEAKAQVNLRSPSGGDVEEAALLPDAVAQQRVTQFVTAVNLSDPAAIKSFIEANGLARPNSSFIFNILAHLRANTAGVELISWRMAGPLVEVMLKNQLTGWYETVALDVDRKSPHHLRGILTKVQPPPRVPPGPLTNERLRGEAENLLSALENADVFSGAVLLARGDDIIHANAYGHANREQGAPNKLETRFSLGSLNKMFTAVAIAQLVEAGKLSFQDPLSKYLPNHFAQGVADQIRVEHLLTHTSGLGDYFNDRYRALAPESLESVDGMLEVVRGDSIAFEPGTRSAYSNTGYLVLGKIIELVSGQSYYDYVREHVYRPAGMQNTTETRDDHGSAVGYERTYTEEGVRFENTLAVREPKGGPAGGGYSTVEDLHRFALALMGGKLVSPSMVEMLLRPKPELSSPKYGFGFMNIVVEDAERSDRLVVGHNGGFRGVSTSLDIVPSTGDVLVVLANHGGDATFRPLALRKLILR